MAAQEDSTIQVWFNLKEEWRPIYAIPLSKLRTLCDEPHRTLLFTAAGPEASLDSLDFSLHYYFECTSKSPLRFPDVAAIMECAPNTTSGSGYTSLTSKFRGLVEERDKTSVMHDETVVDRTAVREIYLLPQAKGTRYLLGLNAYRQVPDAKAVTTIDSIQNGLLLPTSMHRPWSHRIIAFLVVPNAFMGPEHFTLAPNHSLSQLPPNSFLLNQHIGPVGPITALFAPHNAPMRYVQGPGPDCTRSAAKYLLDYLYVVAFLAQFGVEENYPEVVITLPPEPPNLNTSGGSVVEADSKSGGSDNDSESKDANEDDSDSPHKLSTYEALCVLGARVDPVLLNWRRNVAAAT
ncbi:hypothetical protein MKEN_00517900 [Mycena kentingensis (nom. inval.)]|nr:hypothetical protein MKEN_00517900 [Mycena kentingensis (nom. inval.)]